MGFCYLPLKEPKWEKVQDGLMLFPPDRVKLTVNSKKETKGRVKMGKGQDGLLLFSP